MRRNHDDEDDFSSPGPSGVGSADVGKDEQPPMSDFAAVLWVPDPEQTHWWREYWVKRKTDKPGRRTGFVP